jgi:putative phosphoserine phosphatase/1-acylglycerol-3-phosphate O-acyltransferase
MAFFDPQLKGRWGAARLAAGAGVPVVPLGLWGTEKVWPRNARIPNITNVTSPPRVTVRVGTPFSLAGSDTQYDTDRIMAAISALLPEEGRQWREPTEAELRATLPANYSGSLADEFDRRPGTD